MPSASLNYIFTKTINNKMNTENELNNYYQREFIDFINNKLNEKHIKLWDYKDILNDLILQKLNGRINGVYKLNSRVHKGEIVETQEFSNASLKYEDFFKKYSSLDYILNVVAKYIITEYGLTEDDKLISFTPLQQIHFIKKDGLYNVAFNSRFHNYVIRRERETVTI